MSLFGNLGGSQPASSGTSGGGLFGTAGGASSGTTSGLFGNLGGGTSNAQSGTTQATSGSALGGSLFGGLGGAKSTATTTPSLFAGAASTSQQQPQSQQQTGGFSLFGNTASQSTTNNAQQTSGLGQSSLFNTTSTQQQPQQQQQQQQGASLIQANAGSGRSAHFDHLLERGRKRNAGENGTSNFDELPSLQLGLGDIARKVRNLGSGGPSADQVQDRAQDRAAHYLLSASGVKMGSTLRDLNQFSSQAGLAAPGQTQSLFDNDVDGYISNLHSQSTLALIQEGLEQSKRDFDTFLEDNVQIEWDKQRQRIYEHFGLGRQSEDMAASQSAFGSTARGAFGRATARKGRSMGPNSASVNGRSTFGASAAGPPVLGASQSVLGGRDSSDKSVMGGQVGPQDRYARDKQERYMDEVKRLNEARLRENSFSVLHSFSDVERVAGSEYSDHFINAYGALISITGEKTEVEASNPGSNQPKERSFAKDYLDDQPNSVASVRMRKRILDGSRKYLENKFLEQVDEVLRKNPSEALVGGVPSMLNKIRGFVRAKAAFKELGADTESFQKIGEAGDEFPWIIIFFLLRGGLLTEAAEYVREKRNFFQNTDRNFQSAITQYATDPDRRLSPDTQQKVAHTHAQRTRLKTPEDPYRMACYKIVGRCDMSKRNLEPIKETMDDWVWLQFNLAREGNRAEENAGEIFGLEELRTTIKDIGQRHFMNDAAESAGGYGVYFYLATLAGLFEPAVNYLYTHNYVSAVHFAIALDYYGLLRVSDWTTAGGEILTYTTRQQPQLNFGRVVGYYTSDFRAARADAAADYLVLICMNADLPGEAGRQQAELCHEALRELVLETREFSTLLGDVKSNGQTTPGLIQERVPLLKLDGETGLLNTITREAARMADDNGRINDAILLCHLAGEYDSVVTILNRALAEALSVELGQEPLRLEPLKPRLTAAESEQQQQQAGASSSLSMLGTDDPVELAKKVLALYNANSLWWRKVSQVNRETVGILFQLNNAKKVVNAGDYMAALGQIENLRILPLSAAGNVSDIRAAANSFNSYPQEISRNIGNVLLWCIMCCSRHREHLLSGQFEDQMRKVLADQLLQKAKDLMVFAGLIKYKLPPRVFETLAREGLEVGAF